MAQLWITSDFLKLMQEYNLSKRYTYLMWACLVVFLGFMALGISLPFLPGEGPPEENYRAAIICTSVFGVFALFTWITLRKLPYSHIVADEDGLWYKHLSKKDDLVPWNRISKVKERAFFQCLDLFDADGRKLMRVEYQLNGFEELRFLLTKRMEQPKLRRNEFAKGMVYHLFYLVMILGISALFLYVGWDMNHWIGGVGLVVVFLLIREYFSLAYKVQISDKGLIISYPFREKSISFLEVVSVDLKDDFQQGNRFPGVLITVANRKKPYELKSLGVDANVLLKAINDKYLVS